MVVMKLPSLKSCIVSSKLSKGIAHNYYGEPAWPNDILYVFPIVIFGISHMLLGLAIHQPYNKSEDALAFMTPLEILPEWIYLLRILSSKFIGIFSMFSFPGVLLVLACCVVKISIDIKTLTEVFLSLWLFIRFGG